jgi:hypothetical protein
MKKLTTFLILLTILTFSNTASAGFFGDIFKELFGEEHPLEEHGGVNNVRCKVEYTQLDLATGLEKNVKHTTQFEVRYIAKDTNIIYLTTQDFTDKINDWLDESKNNVVSNMTGINCKERRLYVSKLLLWNNEHRWGKYKSCEDEYNLELMNLLDYPKQWGFNVHKERLIKDYDEGCKNYYGESKND